MKTKTKEPKKERWSFRLKTNSDGMHEEMSHPKAPAELVRALLVLSSWGDRELKDIIEQPMYLEIYEETRRFMRAAEKFRLAVAARVAEMIAEEKERGNWTAWPPTPRAQRPRPAHSIAPLANTTGSPDPKSLAEPRPDPRPTA